MPFANFKVPQGTLNAEQKEEIIRAVADGEDEVDAGGSVVSTYRNSDAFIDLCRGPHVPSTGRLKAFKVLGGRSRRRR